MEQDNKTRSGGFWTSLPGILTGLTALVTAVGGIFVASRGGDESPAGNSAAAARVAQAGAPPASTPAGVRQAEIAGEWDIEDDDGTITFEVTDTGEPGARSVEGSYKLGDQEGTLTGTLRGSVLTGNWIEPESGERCESALDESWNWGKIRFEFDAAGKSFTGYYGNCDEKPAIKWNGKRG